MHYARPGSRRLQWCGELYFPLNIQGSHPRLLQLNREHAMQSGAELTFCLLLMEVSNPFLHGRFLMKVCTHLLFPADAVTVLHITMGHSSAWHAIG